MAQAYADLIASVKRRARIPVHQALITSADILAIANDEMLSSFVPLLLQTREEFLVTSADQAIGALRSFTIPADSVKVREVLLVDSSGNVNQIARLRVDQQPWVADGFELRGNTIIISDGAAAGQTSLRIVYYGRPAEITVSTTTVPVPADLFPLFCQYVACAVLRQIGDRTALKDAEDELARMIHNADAIIDDRIEGEQTKVFNADLFGGL